MSLPDGPLLVAEGRVVGVAEEFPVGGADDDPVPEPLGETEVAGPLGAVAPDPPADGAEVPPSGFGWPEHAVSPRRRTHGTTAAEKARFMTVTLSHPAPGSSR